MWAGKVDMLACPVANRVLGEERVHPFLSEESFSRFYGLGPRLCKACASLCPDRLFQIHDILEVPDLKPQRDV